MSIQWSANTVLCAPQKEGCGAFWLEWNAKALEFCPKCGRRAQLSNVIVNFDGLPNVRKLFDPFVLVPFEEIPV